MRVINNRQERLRFIRFMVVGAIGAVMDFGIFNLLTHLTSMPAVWASVISFSAAVTSNFLWNRFWTYPDARTKRVSQQAVQFILVNVTGLLIRTPLFAVLEEPFQRLFSLLAPGTPIPPKTLGHNLALAVAVGVVMLWNFFANRYWTYNDVGKQP
ncbi:MAG: GtrA family protein [Chloroflexi bacterium]|nr:GtrA family protein [Chloroflexota bacterium]